MKESLTKLQKIGFTDYEAKVFMALYQGYAMSAADVAKEAKIPRPSVYSILRVFAKKGLCNEIDTPSKQIYEMIDSSYIHGKIEFEVKSDYEKKMNNLNDCFDTIKPLYKSKKPKEYKTDVELVRGYNLSKEIKFLDLIKSSNQGILIMNRFRGNVSTTLDKEAIDFYKRGGYIKSIYEKSMNFKIKINNEWKKVSKEDLIRICEEFSRQGENIRFLSEVPQIMAVFDEKIVYISLWDENTPSIENSDIIIKNKRFAGFITNLFNLYWDKSDTLSKLKQTLNL
ncbi:MAG TPA: helix-turn-helix domain-containing protein [Ignavibacteria bacterium]